MLSVEFLIRDALCARLPIWILRQPCCGSKASGWKRGMAKAQLAESRRQVLVRGGEAL
jgi:hypothetical protein